MFNFNIDKVNFDEELGSGVSGTVYPYQKDPTDKRWVVKNIVTKDVKQVITHVQEIVLGFNSEHNNILPIRGYHIDYNKEERLWKIYIKLPRMKGSLRAVLKEYQKEKKSLSETKIAEYFYALVKGLQYLHSRNIAHRDIKPDNTLIGEDESIRVADFGLGNFVGGGETSYMIAERVGALFYVAPENQDENFQLKKKDLLKADLWSLGMLILELCNLDLKFLDFSASGKKKEADVQKRIQEMEGKYSKGLLDLISRLLKSEPSERIGLQQVQKELEELYGDKLPIEKQTKEVQVDLEPKVIESKAYDEKDLLERIQQLEQQLGIGKGREEKDEGGQEVPKEAKLKELKRPKKISEDFLEDFPRFNEKLFLMHLEKQKFENKWSELFDLKNIEEKYFSIKVKDYKKIETGTVSSLIMGLATNYENIEGLSLDFSSWYSKSVNVSVREVALQLVSIPNLRRFELNLAIEPTKEHSKYTESFIRDDAIEELSAQIGSHLKNLQKFSLNLKSRLSTTNIITYRSMLSLAFGALRLSKGLQSIDLDFSGNKIMPEGLEVLGTQISQNLPDLQDFSLIYDKSLFITDSMFKKFTTSLSSLGNLQNLRLVLSGSQVTNKAVTAALDLLKHVPNKEISNHMMKSN